MRNSSLLLTLFLSGVLLAGCGAKPAANANAANANASNQNANANASNQVARNDTNATGTSGAKSPRRRLPRTGSDMALFELMSALSVAGGFAVRSLRRQ